MIIRSQNKKELHNLDTIKMINVTTNSLRYFVEVNSQKVIGTYSTEEKAIKVLDMICADIMLECLIFQMPADEDVEV